ncbi:IclR family transcriptional regulator C-terminal domain-containing protein [Azospirillum sp. TSO35-2]|uniref:IclR family transcriptional regulator domain-containing protein n=1 Tax=Azospirillum sp. TSO35-2 TaxID=716796 RepID=UPI001304C6DC|nr:IclR family transcriptional regulator C-terminal domain-containing protein [Azospirillum sp. TSO35-2]
MKKTASGTTGTSMHCRTNSRRGDTNPLDRSYPPVNSVCRALHVLKVVNQQSIATVNSIYTETGIPRPTVVRMLETLMHEGYVIRDNMCGGYRVAQKVTELSQGYGGISRVIEIARPLSIGLTRQIRWPVGLGVIDGDAIEILYWTGTISPVVHTTTVLGQRPDLLKSAMGRAYMAFCSPVERDEHIARMRATLPAEFGAREEAVFRRYLDRVRRMGYATRDPHTEPIRMTTVGVPILEQEKVAAVMSVSFFRKSVAPKDMEDAVLAPLIETRVSIEHALAFITSRPRLDASVHREYNVNL